MTAAAPFELAIERHIDAPLFKVWTERLEEWWAPKPWKTRIVEQDLRPGGRSAMVIPKAVVRVIAQARGTGTRRR